MSYDISCKIAYASSEDSDQPVQLRSLIKILSAFSVDRQ